MLNWIWSPRREQTLASRHGEALDSEDDISSLPSLPPKLGFAFLWVGFIPRQTVSMWKEIYLPEVPSSSVSTRNTRPLDAHKVRNRESLSFIEFMLLSPTPAILSGPAGTNRYVQGVEHFDWPAWVKWLPSDRWDKIDHFICSRKWRKDKCKTQKTENQKEAI